MKNNKSHNKQANKQKPSGAGFNPVNNNIPRCSAKSWIALQDEVLWD